MLCLAEDCTSELSEATLKVKFNLLKNYSIIQIETAVYHLLRTNIYPKMPTTGQIIRAIDGTPNDRAEIQLSNVLKAVRIIGRYGTPKFEDPITHDLVFERYGWTYLCNMPEREIDFFSKNFISAYKAHHNLNSMQIDYCDKKQIVDGE